MIVPLAERVISQLAEIEQRKQAKNINQAISETKIALQQLRSKVVNLTFFIRVNKNRIQGENRQKLIMDAENFRTSIKDSKKLFKTERRQVQQLRLIGNSIDFEYRDAKTAWSIAFRAEMEPIFSSVNLTLKLLPDNAQKNIQTLKNEIEYYFNTPPKDSKQAISLVQKIASLKQYTQDGVFSKRPQVAEFLTKVQSGTATITDLNVEVIKWMNEEKNHKNFKIIFKS